MIREIVASTGVPLSSVEGTLRAGALVEAATLFPTLAEFEARGYDFDDGALYPCNDEAGDAKDVSGNNNHLPPSTSPRYRWVAGDSIGVHFDTNIDAFKANVNDLANDSAVMIFGHVQDAHNAALLGIGGRWDNVSVGCWVGVATATDKVTFEINDGAGHNATGTFATAVPFGERYIVGVLINRTADTISAFLRNLETGAEQTVGPTSIATVLTITGGSAPGFTLGWVPNVGVSDGSSCLGAAVLRGAQVEAANFLRDLVRFVGGAS